MSSTTNDNYWQERAKELNQIIDEARNELEYLKAHEYLVNLQDAATINVVDYLVPNYGKIVKVFENNQITQQWVISRQLKNIKLGIERYQSVSGDDNAIPDWAKEAKKAARIVDNYNNKKNQID